MLLLAIHGCFGGFHIVSGARLHFDKAQDVFLPSDQIDFTSVMWRTKISGDHHISASTQEKIRIFFAAFAGALVFRMTFSRKRVISQPVESADGGVGEAAGEHNSG
jgi:hypothetical protein